MFPVFIFSWGCGWGGRAVCRILVSRPEIKPAPTAMEAVLTMGPPGRSSSFLIQEGKGLFVFKGKRLCRIFTSYGWEFFLK